MNLRYLKNEFYYKKRRGEWGSPIQSVLVIHELKLMLIYLIDTTKRSCLDIFSSNWISVN
jgi:hypothetical protein